MTKPLKGTDKFLADPRAIVYGKQKQAVLGIHTYMKVDANTLRQGMQEGVAAIQREVEAFGTAVDKECLHYVLHMAAGSSDRTFRMRTFTTHSSQ